MRRFARRRSQRYRHSTIFSPAGTFRWSRRHQDVRRAESQSSRRVAYLPAYPVIDALNFPAALQRVGDRVELIGRIVEVKPGSRKRGKGRPKRYVFINFGSARGNIVRISIWSEGLAKMKEQSVEGMDRALGERHGPHGCGISKQALRPQTSEYHGA